jgi:hypothetical protein
VGVSIEHMKLLFVALIPCPVGPLLQLRPVCEALHDHKDAPAPCFKDTRKALIAGIFARTTDPHNKESIEWLAGVAGTGKTSVAISVCKTLKHEKQLGGSFFFSRDSHKRRSFSNVIGTLAYQLAHLTLQLKALITSTICENPNITKLSVRDQLSLLITEPLSKASDLPSVVVFVLDALDECDEEEGEALKLLASALSSNAFNVKVKLFITSRSEGWIEEAIDFSQDRRQPLVKTHKLHHIQDSVVDGDIRLFLRHRLTLIARRLSLKLADWPSEKDLARLVARCGRLFIYAMIVIRYVEIEGASPVTRLQEILQPRAQGDRTYHTELDALYLQILQKGFSSELKDKEVDNIKLVTGTLVLLREPQSFPALVNLVDLENHQVHVILGQLRAVCILPDVFPGEVDELIRVVHPSFHDFLIDDLRCKSQRFFVDAPACHAFLVRRCLAIMNSQLQFNICKLDGPLTNVTKLTTLNSTIKKYISSELAYACRFWLTHMRLANISDDYILPLLLSTFCANRIFAWIEVCSLFDILSSSISGLHAIHAKLQVRHFLPDIFSVAPEYEVSRVSLTTKPNHSFYTTLGDL